MAANFAADLKCPPRRPILDRHLVTSEAIVTEMLERLFRKDTEFQAYLAAYKPPDQTGHGVQGDPRTPRALCIKASVPPIWTSFAPRLRRLNLDSFFRRLFVAGERICGATVFRLHWCNAHDAVAFCQ